MMKPKAPPERLPSPPKRNAPLDEKIAWLEEHEPSALRDIETAADALIAYVRLQQR